MRIYALAFALLLCACDQESAAPPEPIATPVATQAPSPADSDAVTTGTLATRLAIRKALPTDLQTDALMEKIVAWHRGAFRPVVLEPQALALRALESGDLVGVVGGMKDFSTAAEIDAARAKVAGVALGYRSAIALMDVRMAEQREVFRQLLDGRPEADALFDRMGLVEIAQDERARMKSSLAMSISIDSALVVLGETLGRARTPDEDKALRGHLEDFQRGFRRMKGAAAPPAPEAP